jgi:hypothetical protein
VSAPVDGNAVATSTPDRPSSIVLVQLTIATSEDASPGEVDDRRLGGVEAHQGLGVALGLLSQRHQVADRVLVGFRDGQVRGGAQVCS